MNKKEIRSFLARQYIRFLLAVNILSLVNFILIALMASDKLKSLFNIDTTFTFLLFFIPSTFITVWLVGYILDKYARFQEAINKETTDRIPQIVEMQKQLEEIKNMLKGNKEVK